MKKIIKHEIPKIGTTFEKIFNNKIYKIKVVGSLNKPGYELAGRVYKTPTAAAKSITKNEVNGWTFWKMGK